MNNLKHGVIVQFVWFLSQTLFLQQKQMSIPLFEINIVLSFNQSEKMPLSILLFHVLFFQFIFRGASKMFKKV